MAWLVGACFGAESAAGPEHRTCSAEDCSPARSLSLAVHLSEKSVDIGDMDYCTLNIKCESQVKSNNYKAYLQIVA